MKTTNVKDLVDKMVVDEKQQSYPQVIHSQEKVIHRIFTSYPQHIHRVIHNSKPVETALALGSLNFLSLWLLYNTVLDSG
jgi:transposase-like protein